VAGPVLAHKLQVFAAADGARIEGSAYFAGGGKASGARIRVTDAAGRALAELTPDADGRFRYEASAPVEHRILAESGDGHRAEWRIAAAELAGGFPAAGVGEVHTPPENPGSSAPGSAATPPGGAAPLTGTAPPASGLEAAIERAVARQVRPLREELLAARDALRLQDVLGAIGYLFGLAGVGLWWHSRRWRDGG
jgi:nickel transport protein